MKDIIMLLTYDMCVNIKKGETISLNENFELYFYTAGDSLVIIDKVKDIEIYYVQYNSDTKDIILGEL